MLRTAEARLHAEVVRLKAGGVLECRASVAAVCRTVGMEDLEKEEAGGVLAWRKMKLAEKKAAKKEEKAQRRRLSKKTGTAGLTDSLANLNLADALDVALDEGGGAFDDVLGDALDVVVGISDTVEGEAATLCTGGCNPMQCRGCNPMQWRGCNPTQWRL